MIVARSLASFSKWVAIREKDSSRLPDASPARTIFTSIPGNISGNAIMESASVLPFSTLVRTSAIARFSHLFSVCSASICKASFIGTPASVILTNWRQKTLRSLGLTFLPMAKSISLFSTPCSLIDKGSSPSLLRVSATLPLFSASILPFISLPAWSTAT